MAEINFMVGGEAGQGVQTVGFILAKTLSRYGFSVFADQDYESRIRGGHNFYRVRASDSDVKALSESLDFLIALDQNTIQLHQGEVKDGGITIFDQDKLRLEDKRLASLSMPLEKMAQDAGGNKLLGNSVAVGAAIAAAGYDFETLAAVLKEHFPARDVGESNTTAARAGYDHARQRNMKAGSFPTRPANPIRRMFVDGNQSLTLGAMAAGCKFVAGYPMTPTSSILEIFADKGRAYNLVIIQPEDEIAAANMIIGAAFAGVRAMTATSGSGFDLMVEALSLAGNTETPIVVVMGQRPGPATGLPTRTEQGELEFMVYAAHGEFARAVLCPVDIEDCFHAAVKAFNLAEKYQLPVIVMTDHYMATSAGTVPRFDLRQVKIERGLLATGEEADNPDYKRHRFTDSGISPRAFPMQGKGLVVTDADEHDEAGHMIEDAETRRRMVEKRLVKIEGLKAEITPPHRHEAPEPDVKLMGWGSTYCALTEAISILKAEGISASLLQLGQAWPFPAREVALYAGNTASKKIKILTVENNATAQLAHLLRAETGIRVDGSVLKYDGRPFSPRIIADQVKKEVA